MRAVTQFPSRSTPLAVVLEEGCKPLGIRLSSTGFSCELLGRVQDSTRKGIGKSSLHRSNGITGSGYVGVSAVEDNDAFPPPMGDFKSPSLMFDVINANPLALTPLAQSG